MADPKSGIKTSEFWMAITLQGGSLLILLLVVTNRVTADQADQAREALPSIAEAVAGFAAALVQIITGAKYISARTEIKKASLR